MTGPSATVVEAAYRVTTPMFCGGADPETVAELRLPSFKGALRFWWRALAWRRLGRDLAAVREEEAKLFGSSDGGQSRVAMSMRPPRTHQFKKGEILKELRSGQTVGDGVRYLGYGLMEAFASSRKGTRTGELTRPCLRAPFDFRVRMALRTPADVDSLRNALVALGTLGGMGARSRKGFGSLSLRSLHVDGASDWDPPSSPDALGSRIKALYGNGATGRAPSTLPPITAISDHSRHLVATGAGADAIVLLNRLGREQVRYRSWGRYGKILENFKSEQNFEDDHDLMKRQPWQRDTHPERIAFGLPHNYGGRNGQVGPAAPGLDRRASPLFIHIHECGREAIAVVSFLPGAFLPGRNRRISVGGNTVPLVAEEQLYKPIHNFLDRLLDPNKCKESIVANEAPR